MVIKRIIINIIFDLIATLLFFPLFDFLNYNLDLEPFFIDFPFLSINSKNPLYKVFNNIRGKNYHLCGKFKKNNNHFLITTWVIIHALYYLIRGILSPNLYFYNLVYSILFEFYESLRDCHDIMDVLINIIFYYIGSKISKNLF